MNENFTIRVYGILINERKEVLISDERLGGFEFTKFPGGGLEYGEGLVDGLIREFQEECQLDVDVIRHVHTTEQFVQSAINQRQVIAVHYEVSTHGEPRGHFSDVRFDFADREADGQVFRWIPLREFDVDELTFDTDKEAWRRFVAQYGRSSGNPA